MWLMLLKSMDSQRQLDKLQRRMKGPHLYGRDFRPYLEDLGSNM